jgi:hypothetical protein
MIKFRVDPSAALGLMTLVETRQLPYAVSLALNRTANLGQKAEQAHIKGSFRLRREKFIMRGIKIEKADRATRSSWRVVIQVAAPQDFLNRAEKGDPHLPFKGRHLWMPNAAVFADRIVSRKNPLHPSNIKFNARKQAANGVFMVKNANGTNVVLQRVGKGARGVAQAIARGGLKGARVRDAATGRLASGGAVNGIRRGGVRLLYVLVSRTRTPARLEFVHTITNTVSSHWASTMTEAMAEAVSKAR